MLTSLLTFRSFAYDFAHGRKLVKYILTPGAKKLVKLNTRLKV